MRKQVLLALLVVAFACHAHAGEPRIRINFDFDWKFALNLEGDFSVVKADDGGWSCVQLPHDWSITLPFDPQTTGSAAHLPGGLGWYRKTFTLPPDMRGKQVAIHFDGIFMNSDVWLNGHHLGHRPYGFCSQTYDLTPWLSADGRTVARSSGRDTVQTLTLKNPNLWSVDTPYLYNLETTVRQGGKTVDRTVETFGVRTIGFDADRGFLLNGERLKLQGLCLHQDDGSFGCAVPDRAYERRLEILKEYGCNALRMSHNPPSPELLDLCDRMGFVVIDNGDLRRAVPFGPAQRQLKTYFGRALVRVQSSRKAGEMRVRLRVDGISEPLQAVIKTRP